MAETSTKPYLIRAIHEWCTDNGYTPYVAVHVDARTLVPREHVHNGEIVLNVSSMATSRLQLGNDLIVFQARFGGTPRELSIPVDNVSAIYARENGHGMAFEVTPQTTAGGDADASGGAADAAPSEPLSAVEDPASSEAGGEGRPAGAAGRPPVLVSVSNESQEPADASAEAGADPDPDKDPEPPGPKPRQSRPKLTRIK